MVEDDVIKLHNKLEKNTSLMLKENINLLINQNRLSEAKELLSQYEKLVKEDIDIYSIKAVIAMIEGNLTIAEQLLLKGLEINSNSFDLLYNLGFLYQTSFRNELALEYYKRAFLNANNEDDKSVIKQLLEGLGFSVDEQMFKMEALPKTSIIVLTYNNIQLNKLCIDSIRKYTTKDTFEIIVVDNGSTDGTVEWLKQQRDLKLILNNENLGFPKGCNQGIRVAEKENDILLLNNDTVVAPYWLTNLKTCLYDDINTGAVGPVTNNCSYYQSISVDYKDLDEMVRFASEYNKSNSEKWEKRVKLVGFCMLIKRSVVDEIGLLDEMFSPGNFEDDDYSIRIQEHGYSLTLCKDTFIHHFGSATFHNVDYDYSQLIHKNAAKFQEKWGFNPQYSTIIRSEIIDLINTNSEERINVLEVGCACGATLLKIKDLYKNADLYGIEFDKTPSRIASNFANIRSEDVEKSELSYDENFFDYIIFADVLEHLYNPDIVLKNIKKYLKKDGKILISIPNISHFSIIKNLFNQRWEYQEWGILDKTHVSFFTVDDLQRMINQAGYNIKKIKIKEFGESLPEDELLIKTLLQMNTKGHQWQYKAYQYLLVISK